MREVIEQHLRRLDTVGPALNAVVTRCDERALAEAEAADRRIEASEALGSLHGLPFTAKDALDTAGVRTTAGSSGWSERIPGTDATVVARLRQAGAILIGKTNTPELTLDYETDNRVFGQTYNPYDTSLSPGGSSGGGAAAVASGITPVDLGTDTGGSIRLPAHFCGIAGLKPSFGRVPRTGLAGVFGTPIDPLTHVGPLARSVDDLELVLGVLAGPDGRDPLALPLTSGTSADVAVDELRIAHYADDGTTAASEGVREAVEAAVAVLADRGAAVTGATPPGLEQTRGLFGRMFVLDGYTWMGDLLEEMGVTDSPLLPEGVFGEVGPATGWTELFRRLDRFRRRMLTFLDHVDVIVAPVHPEAAQPPHVLTGRDRRPGFAYAQTYNLTGWPVATVRAGTSPEGLPLGVQVIAGPGREDRAIAVARVIEGALGGWTPPPDLPLVRNTNDPGQ